MRMMIKCFLSILFLFIWASSVWATPVLWDWAFNVDGTTYENYNGDVMPTLGLLDTNGLGTLSWSTGVVGDHSFIAFFDFAIDEFNAQEGTYYSSINEYGHTSGSMDMGQSYEIDEPGWVFGDIYWNVLVGTLDNYNAINSMDYPYGDDVSLALGWDFSLDIGQTATITMSLTQTLDSYNGFYLSQIDAETQETIYFYSALDIQDGGVIPEPVPEPATMFLLGSGLVGLVSLRKRILN